MAGAFDISVFAVVFSISEVFWGNHPVPCVHRFIFCQPKLETLYSSRIEAQPNLSFSATWRSHSDFKAEVLPWLDGRPIHRLYDDDSLYLQE